MLNVLSFFFINELEMLEWMHMLIKSFDAQCSELFLYIIQEFGQEVGEICVSMLNVLSFFFIILTGETIYYQLAKVSMLNVLSFFFIAHSTTAMNKHLLRGISEEISPCALFIHFYHYTMINKAVENCSEKILKLKIISPLSLYKYL